MSERYNGWKNHATWCVNLHWSNTQAWAEELDDMARRAIAHAPNCEQVKRGIWTIAEAERFNLAAEINTATSNILTEFVDKDPLRTAPTLFAWDMVSGYLGEVDWDEIARAALDSVRA